LFNEQPLPPEVGQRYQQLRVVGSLSQRPAEIRRVLVRAPNWVGDAVMSLPVLAGLSRVVPQARITVLAAPRVAPIFQALPDVTEVMAYPAGREKWRLLWSLRKGFDLALALPNSFESALGLWLAGARERAGYNADGRRLFLTLAVNGRQELAGLHTVYYYLGLLKIFGAVDTFRPPTLHLTDDDVLGAQEILAADPGSSSRPWVGLSPGAAYGPAKRWPPERFAALAQALMEEHGVRLLILGGLEDQEAAAQVKERLQSPVLDLVGRTSLRQALGVLGQLKLLITNDSGLMHAAAALSVPLVALFGSTDPKATGPFTSRATVLYHPLACSPCLKRTCEEGYLCLTAISVAEVQAAARRWLKES